MGILNFFPVEKLIFGNCKKMEFGQKHFFVKLIYSISWVFLAWTFFSVPLWIRIYKKKSVSTYISSWNRAFTIKISESFVVNGVITEFFSWYHKGVRTSVWILKSPETKLLWKLLRQSVNLTYYSSAWELNTVNQYVIHMHCIQIRMHVHVYFIQVYCLRVL